MCCHHEFRLSMLICLVSAYSAPYTVQKQTGRSNASVLYSKFMSGYTTGDMVLVLTFLHKGSYLTPYFWVTFYRKHFWSRLLPMGLSCATCMKTRECQIQAKVGIDKRITTDSESRRSGIILHYTKPPLAVTWWLHSYLRYRIKQYAEQITDFEYLTYATWQYHSVCKERRSCNLS